MTNIGWLRQLGKKRLKVQLKRLQDDCADDNTNDWIGGCTDGNTNVDSASSSDVNLSLSPGITRSMRKVFSSNSSEGDGSTDQAKEGENNQDHSPTLQSTDEDMSINGSARGVSIKQISGSVKQTNIPRRI